jgi:hypothetical protein
MNATMPKKNPIVPNAAGRNDRNPPTMSALLAAVHDVGYEDLFERHASVVANRGAGCGECRVDRRGVVVARDGSRVTIDRDFGNARYTGVLEPLRHVERQSAPAVEKRFLVGAFDDPAAIDERDLV